MDDTFQIIIIIKKSRNSSLKNSAINERTSDSHGCLQHICKVIVKSLR